MMTQISYLFDRSLELNRNLTTEHLKIVKISGFYSFFFCLNCQIPGKVATQEFFFYKKTYKREVFHVLD